MVLPSNDDEQAAVLYCGLWYLDIFVRVGDAWRIRERAELKSYLHVSAPESAKRIG